MESMSRNPSFLSNLMTDLVPSAIQTGGGLIKQNAMANAYENLGYTKKEAKALSMMPEDFTKQYMTNKFKYQANDQAQQMMNEVAEKYGMNKPTSFTAALNQPEMQQPILPTEQQQPMQPTKIRAPENLGTLLNQLATQKAKTVLNQVAASQLGQEPQLSPADKASDEAFRQAIANAQPIPPEPIKQPMQPAIAPKVAPSVAAQPAVTPNYQDKANAMRRDALRLSASGDPRLQKFAEQINEQAKALEDKAQRAWDKSAKFRESIEGAEENAYNQLEAIKQLQQIDNTGTLDKPGKAIFANVMDQVLGEGAGNAWLTHDSQTFNKIRAQFISGVKGDLGGRISNLELNAFMKKFPSLTNTKEGRAQIYELFNSVAELKAQEVRALDDVIKDNGGFPPDNIREQYRARSRTYKDEIKDDIARRINAVTGASQEISANTKPLSIVDSLNEAVKYPEGSKIRDVATGKWSIIKQGKLVPYERAQNAR